MVKKMNNKELISYLQAMGLEVPFLTTGVVTNNRIQAMICDYRHLTGYKVAFCVGIYDNEGALLERINVPR